MLLKGLLFACTVKREGITLGISHLWFIVHVHPTVGFEKKPLFCVMRPKNDFLI